MTASPWVILKFGGTSVSTLDCWQTIADITKQRLEAGYRPFLVCSAIEKVSRNLDALLRAAKRGEGSAPFRAIRTRHLALAAALDLDGAQILMDDFTDLEQIVLGISLTHDVSPALKARVLAKGELMLTKLGAAYLHEQGLNVAWRDARKILRAVEEPHMVPHKRYLSAHCHFERDAELQAELNGSGANVVLTQGFIAGGRANRTVVIGWGGSDTSAAYFASKLEAKRLEIWSDVPGLFAADPNRIPSARLLKRLDYDEAQELASTGAEVLHPRCIDPLRSRGIPLVIRCTAAPHISGTVIAADVPNAGAKVKAISARAGVMLISMETPRMWQQIGFLARAFAVFERHAVSVDLVATSGTNVTVSLDPINGADHSPSVLEALLADLNLFCAARQIGPCAAVSLVGRRLRRVLHELGPALETLDQERIYLVTQAASDLNLTFVVEEDQAARLVDKLYEQLFGRLGTDHQFGPTYREMYTAAKPTRTTSWWRKRRDDLLALAEVSTPQYIYDEDTLHEQVTRAKSIDPVERCFYAMKACDHPDVMRLMHDDGLSFECVSPGELEHVHGLFPGVDISRILFTPNFAPREEYEIGFQRAGYVTLDSIRPLELWPELFTGRDVLVRVDPGRGHGHHRYVRTAGAQSKFGVAPEELQWLRHCARVAGARVIGLHAHAGSGIMTTETWSETALFLASLADEFPDIRILNVGGGFGVPERPGAMPLDEVELGQSLAHFQAAYPEFSLWMEPGRYLVSEAGVLLSRVTQVKRKGRQWFVGIDAGMNTLVRPALYGSYHRIVNLSNLDAPSTITADIVGPICETGDVLGRGRRLPETKEGDILLIATAGAYGHVMSTRYNMREPARVTLLESACQAVTLRDCHRLRDFRR